MVAKTPSRNGYTRTVIIVGIVAVLLGVIGCALWYNFAYKSSSDAQIDETIINDATETSSGESYEALIPEGWSVRENTEPAISYAAPTGMSVAYSGYRAGDMINVGYGAPVYVRYDLSEGWQTYQDDEGGPVLRGGDNLVKSVDVMAEDKYPASYYDTGDGMAGESRVLIVTDGDVHQFAFTAELQDEDSIKKFVGTVSFRQ